MKDLLKIAGFIALAVIAWMQFKEQRSAKTWPSVTATVTRSEVQSRTKPRDNDKQWETLEGRTVYEANVGYRYEIDGVQYNGNRIKVNSSSYASRSTAEQVLAEYPVGKSVTAYYNPEEPGASVLKR
ncbi:MAG: DUF3592 domain-containing protein [Pseudomonadota bacterium]